MNERETYVRRGQGPKVLLLHPFMTSHHVWRRVIDDLARDHDVLAVTFPGHHGSPRSPRATARALTPLALARHVEAHLDRIGWKECHIAGNSLGGWVALELARGGRARSVTAFAPAGGWRPWSLDMLAVGAKFAAVAPIMLSRRLSLALARRLPRLRNLGFRLATESIAGLPPEDIDAVVESVVGCHGFTGVLMTGLRGTVATGLHEVTCPVRLVLGSKDRIVPPPRCHVLYTEGIAHAETIILDGLGHVPMLQDPALCARVIRDHVASAERTSAAA